MNAADAIAMSMANLRRRRGRTALTAAGVIVGVAALVMMVSLGLGLQRQVLKLFQTEDALRTLSVTRVRTGSAKSRPKGFNPFDFGGQIVPIAEKDLADMRAIPGVELALPDLNMLLHVTIDRPGDPAEVNFFPVAGVAPSEEKRYREVLVRGGLWKSPAEKACLLPSSLLELKLNARPEEVVGRKVTFRAAGDEDAPPEEELVYTVAGVLDSERVGIRGRQIFLPMERALELRDATKGGLFTFLPYKKGTYASAEVRMAHPSAAPDIKARLKNSGYNVVGASDMIESINLIFLVVEGFMACVGAIGLVVSLFGIANTMAMAVLERTREIGIMKALGARNRDIGRVFLAEAGAIGALGGVVGLGLGFLAGLLLNAAARGIFDMPDRVSLFHVPLWLAAGSVFFSIFVSVLAGTVPARRAARLDPVVALRYE